MSTGPAQAAWTALLSPSARAVDVPTQARYRRSLRSQLEQLPAGVTVALHDRRPLSRGRCRRLARRSGLVVQREFVALPSLRRTVYVVEDDRASMRFAWSHLITPPPGAVWLHAPLSLLIAAGRLLPWWALGCLAPGRVVLVSRP